MAPDQYARLVWSFLYTVDLYAIPNEQRLQNLVTWFCSTMGTVLPYIDAKSLVHDSLQLARGSVW
jgi:hypothetical protein